jgi:hypothetical protein
MVQAASVNSGIDLWLSTATGYVPQKADAVYKHVLKSVIEREEHQS